MFRVFRSDSRKNCCIFMRRVTTFSYSKLLSLTSNNQTHNISPSPPLGIYIPLSVLTRCVCVFGVVTARLLRRSAYIPFIPDSPQGSAPPLRITDRVWGNRTDAGPGRWRTSPRSNDIHAARYCTDSNNQRQDEFIRKSCLSGQKSHESGGGKTTSTCAPSAPEL